MSTATARILAALDAISAQTAEILHAIDDGSAMPADRREIKRRTLAIRSTAHELIEWLSAARLDEPRN